MVLNQAEIDNYLAGLSPEQAETVRFLRSLILSADLPVREHIETGKWYTGLLVYETESGLTVYALGPLSGGFTTFHSMAYYGSAKLQASHGAALKKVLTGKSCLKVRRVEELPADAIHDIIAAGPAYVEAATKMFEERRRKGKTRVADRIP